MSERLTALKEFMGSSTSEGPIRAWWVFPSPQKPRFLVPTDPSFWQEGLSFVSSRKKRLLLRILLSFYRLIRRKADLQIAGPWPSQLTDLFEEQVIHLAIYVSTPNRFSKYTLVFLNDRAEPLGFGKLSEGKDADSAIEDEVKALNFLAQEFPENKTFPRVIYHAPGFAVQSPAPSSGHGRLAENAGRIAAQLFRSQVREISWVDSQTRNSLIRAKQEIQKAKRADLTIFLDEMERELSLKFQKTPLREGLTHGDFVSWNMADCPEGFVFDWEWLGHRAEYHDLFHFLWFRELQSAKNIQLTTLLSRWQSKEAQSLLKSYQGDQVGPLYGDALLYLASCFAFYSRHCIANQNDPLAFPFVLAILKSFQDLAKRDHQIPCQSLYFRNK